MIMKKSTLLMGAALLGATASITPAAVNAATNTTTATTQAQTQNSMILTKGTLKVAVGKTLPVYASPNDSTPIAGKTLKAGSSWRYFGQENANGYLWINLGGNQWVNSADPSAFSLVSAVTSKTAVKTTTASKTATKTATTSKTASKTSSTKASTTAPASIITPGKVSLTPGHSVSVYTSPSADTPTSKKLAGGTTWKMFSQVTYRGYLWVNVGGNQWINDSDPYALNLNYTTAKSSKTSTKTATKTTSKTTAKISTTTKNGIASISGTVTIHYVPGYGIAVWDAPQGGAVTGKKLADGSTWRVFKSTTVNGVTWYNLGGNQWISGTYAKLQSTAATKTVAKSGTITTNAKTRTDIYLGASTKKVSRTVGKNVKLKYYGTTSVKGQTWYFIGDGEWVNGTDVK